MILDKYLAFAEAVNVTSSAISDVVDFGTVQRSVGVGEPLVCVITIDADADFTTTNETYVISLETDSVAALSSAVVLGSVALVGAQAAGSKFVINVPADARMEEFLGVRATLGGTTPDLTYSAYLRPHDGVDNYQSYANGYTISG